MVRTNSYTPHYLPQCCCKLQAAVDKFLQSDCLWTSHTHEIQWSQPVSEHIKQATFSWLASLKWLSNASQNMGSMCFTSLINLIFWFSFKLILRARVCIYSYRKRSDSIINNLKHWYYFIGKSNMPHNLVVIPLGGLPGPGHCSWKAKPNLLFLLLPPTYLIVLTTWVQTLLSFHS